MSQRTAHRIINVFTGIAIGVGVAITLIAAVVPVPAVFLVPFGIAMLLAWCAVGWIWLTRG